MPFTANRQFKANPRLLARAEGMHYWTPGRPPDPRRRRRACGASTPATAAREITEAVSRQIAEMDYAPPFQMGHPAAFELAERGRAAGAGRARPRVLHQLRLRVGGHRAEDRARLPPRARRRHAHPLHRPRARLPRRRLRRHLGRRHGRQPQVLRHACCRASTTCRTRTTSRTTPSPRGQPGVGRAPRRRAGAHRRAARRDQHRRGDRRAGGGLHRRADAAARATCSACARSAPSTASC